MVLFTITRLNLKDKYPIRANIWFWVQPSSLELFVFCCVVVLWNWLGQRLLVLILVLVFCGKNYVFARPAGLRRVVARVPIGCEYYPSFIYHLWYKREWRVFKLALIVSAFVDTETCTCVCYQIVFGPYPNRTYGIASPAGLWNVVLRVPVGSLYFPLGWGRVEGVWTIESVREGVEEEGGWMRGLKYNKILNFKDGTCWTQHYYWA